MVGDELPLSRESIYTAVRGWSSGPRTGMISRCRGPLEASVKIWFCQPCVSTGSILEKPLREAASFFCSRTWKVVSAGWRGIPVIALSVCQQKVQQGKLLSLMVGHYQNYITSLCIQSKCKCTSIKRGLAGLSEACGPNTLPDNKQMIR